MTLLNNRRKSTVVNSFIIYLLFCTAISGTFAVSCRSYGRQLGLCVVITRCPRLLAILLSSNRTNQDLRMLQKLTCITEISDLERDPVVCCPLSEISDVLTNNQNNSDDDNSGGFDESNKPASTTTPTQRFQRVTSGTTTTVSPQETYDELVKSKFHLLPTLNECSNSFVTNRIIGGKNVSHGTHPWMARLGYRHKGTGKLEYYCGGSVISKRYVLSAGHCTQGFDDSFVLSEVRLGEHDTNIKRDCNHDFGDDVCSDPEDYKIEEIITHPDHNTGTKQNDIALIRLSQDITFDSYFVRPICLPFLKEYKLPETKRSDFESSMATVAGWGRQLWNKTQGSQQLLEVTIPIVPNSRCQELYRRRIRITSKQMCAGGKPDKDSCSGDSGGPLMAVIQIPNKVPKSFQFGIVSFGQIQCGGLLPGVYTRISEYLPWILKNIQP